MANGPCSWDLPLDLFGDWFRAAQEHESEDPNAMTLATASKEAFPSARIVLLKDFDPQDFVFYTNKQSRKGNELSENPKASLLFYWKSLGRQVRIEGHISHIDPQQATAYYHSRPRLSQIGAWASQQSQPLENRETLIARVKALEEQYKDQTITRPEHWGGYLLSPIAMEFWQAGDARLHDRWRFTLVPNKANQPASWMRQRLNP